MAVKIRLARRGRKKRARFDVVVADARSPRDGRFIEKIGLYDPNTNPATIELNEDKAFKWVMDGAQPTETVRAMLSYRGIMMKKHLQLGVLKGAITQEDADKKFEDWRNSKDAKIQSKVEGLVVAKEDKKKAALAAESKVKEARAEALKAKRDAEAASLVAEINDAAAPADEALEEEVAAVEEAQVAVAEAPAAEAVEEAPKADVTEEAAPAA
jgi:small subunit ribosomal protein S16